MQDNYGTWRIKTQAELETLNKKENTVIFIKSQRLQRAARVIRIDPLRTVKKLTEREPCPSIPVGKPRLRWIDQVEDDLTKMKVRNWRQRSVKIEDCGMTS
jgi:hypothetical protein